MVGSAGRSGVEPIHAGGSLQAVVRRLDPTKPVLFVHHKDPWLTTQRSWTAGKLSLFRRLREGIRFFGRAQRRAFRKALKNETRKQKAIIDANPKLTDGDLAAPVDVFEANGNTIVVYRPMKFSQHKAMTEIVKDPSAHGLAVLDVERARGTEWGFVQELSFCVGSNGFVKTKDGFLLVAKRAGVAAGIDASPDTLATSYSGPPRMAQFGHPPVRMQLLDLDRERAAREINVDIAKINRGSYRTHMMGTQSDGGPVLVSSMELDMSKDELLRASEMAAEKYQNEALLAIPCTREAILERLDPNYAGNDGLLQPGASWFAPAFVGFCEMEFGAQFSSQVAQKLGGLSRGIGPG
jgi:hypothetical protein